MVLFQFGAILTHKYEITFFKVAGRNFVHLFEVRTNFEIFFEIIPFSIFNGFLCHSPFTNLAKNRYNIFS